MIAFRDHAFRNLCKREDTSIIALSPCIFKAPKVSVQKMNSRNDCSWNPALLRPDVAGFRYVWLAMQLYFFGACVHLSRFINIIKTLIPSSSLSGVDCVYRAFLVVRLSLLLPLYPPLIFPPLSHPPPHLVQMCSVYLCSTPHLYVWNKALGQCYNLGW